MMPLYYPFLPADKGNKYDMPSPETIAHNAEYRRQFKAQHPVRYVLQWVGAGLFLLCLAVILIFGVLL
jgi:hypothetical protein